MLIFLCVSYVCTECTAPSRCAAGDRNSNRITPLSDKRGRSRTDCAPMSCNPCLTPEIDILSGSMHNYEFRMNGR